MADEIEEATLEEFIAEPEPKKPRLMLIIAAAVAVLLIAAVVGSILMLGRAPAPAEPVEDAAHEPAPPVQTADDNVLAALEAARAAAEGDLPAPEPEAVAPAAPAAPAPSPPLPPAQPKA